MGFSLSKQNKFFLKLLVAVLLSGFLILKIDWKFVLKEFSDLHWPWLLVYLVLQVVSIFFSVKRWQAVAAPYGITFATDEGMFAYLKGMFLNNFLPTTIGGDAYRCFWLGERSGKPAASYASVVLDRVTGLFVTTLAAFAAGIFILQLIIGRELFTFTYMGIFMAVIIAGAVLLNAFFGWGKLPFQHKKIFQKNFFVFLLQKRSWKNIQGILFWSGAFTIIGLIVSNYILFLALGMPLPPLAFSAVMLAVILYSNIPISINNIGLKEWAYATFFVYLGVPVEAAVAAALLSRIFQVLISSLAVPLAFFLEEDLLFTRSAPPQGKRPEEAKESAQ